MCFVCSWPELEAELAATLKQALDTLMARYPWNEKRDMLAFRSSPEVCLPVWTMARPDTSRLADESQSPWL